MVVRIFEDGSGDYEDLLEAVNSISSGDIIELGDSTLLDDIVLVKSCLIRPVDGAEVKIYGTIYLENISDVTLENLEIYGCIVAKNAQNLKIVNCKVINGDGFDFENPPSELCDCSKQEVMHCMKNAENIISAMSRREDSFSSVEQVVETVGVFSVEGGSIYIDNCEIVAPSFAIASFNLDSIRITKSKIQSSYTTLFLAKNKSVSIKDCKLFGDDSDLEEPSLVACLRNNRNVKISDSVFSSAFLGLFCSGDDSTYSVVVDSCLVSDVIYGVVLHSQSVNPPKFELKNMQLCVLGIALLGNASFVADSCSFKAKWGYAVIVGVSDSLQSRIANCLIFDSYVSAMFVVESSIVFLENSSIIGGFAEGRIKNHCAVYVENSGKLTLNNVTISEIPTSAIRANKNSSVYLNDVKIKKVGSAICGENKSVFTICKSSFKECGAFAVSASSGTRIKMKDSSIYNVDTVCRVEDADSYVEFDDVQMKQYHTKKVSHGNFVEKTSDECYGGTGAILGGCDVAGSAIHPAGSRDTSDVPQKTAQSEEGDATHFTTSANNSQGNGNRKGQNSQGNNALRRSLLKILLGK